MERMLRTLPVTGRIVMFSPPQSMLARGENGRFMLRKSYYLTLGIPPNESADGIRQAFREIVKRYHPDRVGTDRAVFFQKIVEAYRVLADPKRRRDYDEGLCHAGLTAAGSETTLCIGSTETGDLPQPVFTLRRICVRDAPFEAALARVSGTLTSADIPFTETEYGEGLNTMVILSADEARQGGAIDLAVPSCSPCHQCGGSGRQGLFPCAGCDGEGLIEEEESMRVLIPPDVPDGTVMEFPLRGLGVHDFYLRLHIRIAP
jgi:DnaJ-class molecular chaperone